MIKIVGNKIYLTRGDTAMLKVVIYGADREEYTPDETDTVTLTVKKNTGSDEILIQRKIEGGFVTIEPEDTADLTYGDYVYDICIKTESGIVQTFIPPSLFRVMEEVNY